MNPARRPRLPANAFLAACVGASLVLHLAVAGRYGIFRDEMYLLALAQHLDWGFVDCPPGGVLMGWLAGHLFGHSLVGLRLLPALAGAAAVWGTGKLAQELGGGAFAQGLAALAVAVAPIYALFGHWLTLNALEPLCWIGAAWCVLRSVNRSEPRYWLGFGFFAGAGLETKYSMAFLVAGVALGLALTPERRWLGRRHFWAGLGIAALIALPNFLWQALHGFPFLELRRHIAENHRDVVRGPIAFVADQALILNPALAPLWAGGVLWLLFGSQRKRYGVLGWAYLAVLGAFIVLKGKNYYVTPAYPMVFAAGAAGFERITASEAGRRWRTASTGVALVGGAALLPMVLPILSPAGFLRYRERLGFSVITFEHQESGALPQYFADEFGWEEMVREVARAYDALTPEEQAKVGIFSNNWGDAAAIDFFGPKYGLPPAISKNDQYWLWGPRGCTGEIVLIVHSGGQHDREFFASVEKVGRVQSRYSRPDEWFDLYLGRKPKADLRTLWPSLKLYD